MLAEALAWVCTESWLADFDLVGNVRSYIGETHRLRHPQLSRCMSASSARASSPCPMDGRLGPLLLPNGINMSHVFVFRNV